MVKVIKEVRGIKMVIKTWCWLQDESCNLLFELCSLMALYDFVSIKIQFISFMWTLAGYPKDRAQQWPSEYSGGEQDILSLEPIIVFD